MFRQSFRLLPIHPRTKSTGFSGSSDKTGKSLKERVLSKLRGATPLVNRTTKAKDVIPEMISGKVQAPSKLGKVQIGKMLGQGAFGKVFLASNEPSENPTETPDVLQKTYVVKDQNLGKDISKAKARKEQAQTEVNFQRQAKGAVKITEERTYEKDDELHHQVMMEHGGKELLTLLEYDEKTGRMNPLDEGTSRAIGSQLFSQLADLHEQGVAHRDIKPENVLLNHQGKARLADFGLSQQANTENPAFAPNARKFSGISGTPTFMAPEVVSWSTYSEKADCWSMGMMLTEMLTGESAPDLYSRVVNRQGERQYQFDSNGYRRFRQSIDMHPSLSPDAKNIILALTSMDPKQRPTAQQALSMPFFQTGKKEAQGAHFQLQNQHQKKFETLAKFEKMLENAEAKRQTNTDDATSRDVVRLERQVDLTGLEVKELQAKMQFEEFIPEITSLEKAINELQRQSPLTREQTTKLEELSIRCAVTKRDSALKNHEASYLESKAYLVREKNSVLNQLEHLEQNQKKGQPTPRTMLALMQKAPVFDKSLKDIEQLYQLESLKVKNAYYQDNPSTLTRRQKQRKCRLPLKNYKKRSTVRVHER